MDSITEEAMMEAIQHLGGWKTAYRLSTVRLCDPIHLLEQGRIVAWGSFNQPLEASEQFRARASQFAADGGS